MSDPLPPAALNPSALPLSAAAQLFSKLGTRPVTVAELEKDISSGAPQNQDGTLNLIHFAAWLVKEMGNDR